MYNLYFECSGIKINLIGTIDCIYEIQYVKKIEISNSCDYLEKVKAQLCAYLSGENPNLSFNYNTNTTPFKTNIYQTLINTEVGEFLSYKELGKRAQTNAYRAVGTAMRTNKLPIIIPCHRVVKNDHQLGNYAGGVAVKEFLFYLESNYAMQAKALTKVTFSPYEYAFVKNHHILQKISNKMPLRESFLVYNDYFSCLISKVIYQLISYASAKKMEMRLYSYFNYVLTPEDILKLTKKEAKIIELPLNKLAYMQSIAHFYLENQEFFATIETKTVEEITRKLKQVHGIGRWTIEMFLIFGLGRKDIFSFDDLVLLNCYKHLYQTNVVDRANKQKFLAEIKGYETVVAFNMWSYMEKKYYLVN